MLLIADPPVKEEIPYIEGTFLDYGEGKSREQEAMDSMRMLAMAMLMSGLFLLGIFCLVVWAFYL